VKRILDFLKRLTSRVEAPEPGSTVEELWEAELSGAGKGRFLAGPGPGYAARYEPGRLELELARPDLFAWTEAPLYRHVDLVLEGSFLLPKANFDTACGFLFRYADEGNFYAALVSSKGYFRLDAVFNGKPRPVVAWTEIPLPLEEREEGFSFSLRVIARGEHFTLCVNDHWAAEAADGTFRSGHLAFAAQRYGASSGAEPPRFALLSCLLESRPFEVEAQYYRWNRYILPDAAARRRLAETYFAMGEYLAAAVQIRKIERRRALDADECFLKAEVALRLELREEAEAALDACLAADAGRKDAAEEKANLLYIQGRNLELREALAALLPQMPGNARLLCLSGHARFALGDFAGAAADYRAAADLDPAQALFRMNEARAWDQAKRPAEAASAYFAAASLFYAQEADDDLELALNRLMALRPRREEVRTIRAKTLFRQGKREEATRLLAELARKGSRDSAVHYLLGIALTEKGERAKALGCFRRAIELEPDCALYAFRLAESLFLIQGAQGAADEVAAAVARALELAPGDGWVLNLAGQAAAARSDPDEARRFFEAACAALPEAFEPALNLAELESREGRLEAAASRLAPFGERAECRNAAGNAYARAAGGAEPERRDELLLAASRHYEAACSLAPGEASYQANLAAAYFELERYSDAEERARRALDLGPEPRAYLIAGELALVFGDRARAEASFRVGLEASPRDGSLLFALGRLHLGLGRTKKAEELAKRLIPVDPDRARRLEAEILERNTERLECATCGRAWRVPRDLPAQSRSNIRAMPPDGAPAGACPRCGKAFCISCRKGDLVDMRFTCPDCGEFLKLSDNRLRYLVRKSLSASR
jgi:tetratricopeptide (TPR) repeat protein